MSEDEDKKGNERESFEKEEVPERKNKIAEKVREDADKIKGGAMVNIVETPEESRVLDSIVTSLRQEVPKAERVFKRRGRVKMALKVHENFDPLENNEIQGLREEYRTVYEKRNETIRWNMTQALLARGLESHCKPPIRLRNQVLESRPQRVRFKPAQDILSLIS